jgi:ABC-2 type transport system permease protein
MIPLFFFVVNIGQAGKVFPKATPFLHGQGYAAFSLPSLLLRSRSDLRQVCRLV